MGVRCAAKCTASAEYGPTCVQHTRQIYKVVVKESTIPGAGLGLFAAESEDEHSVAFAPGKHEADVVRYEGTLMTETELDAKYPNTDATYVLRLSRNLYVDASDINSCLGRFINHSKDPNTFFQATATSRGGKRGSIRALRNIMRGEEITVDYGEEYNTESFSYLQKQ